MRLFYQSRVPPTISPNQIQIPLIPEVKKHAYSPPFLRADLGLDPLQPLFLIFPRTEGIFRGIIRSADLERGIKSTEFQIKKERILVLYHLLGKLDGLDRSQIQTLANAVLDRRDSQTILGLLKDFGTRDNGDASGGIWKAAKERVTTTLKMTLRFGDEGGRGSKSSKLTKEEMMWRDANHTASLPSDSRFLSQLKDMATHECLRDATVEAEAAAYAYLPTVVETLVDGIGKQILVAQKQECDKQIDREITSEGDREFGTLRSDFVRLIEDLYRERTSSYVPHSFKLGEMV